MVKRSRPAKLEDFVFYHPFDYVERLVGLMEASEYHCWPAAGGLEDQDPLLLADIETFIALRTRAEWERDNPDGDDEDEEPPDETQVETIG